MKKQDHVSRCWFLDTEINFYEPQETNKLNNHLQLLIIYWVLMDAMHQ